MTARQVQPVVLVSLLTLLASAVSFTLTPAPTSAQAPHGVELRLAARGNDDGSVSVGLQYRLDNNGNWRPVQPTRNRLPAAAEADRWHVTNAAEIEAAQAQVEIGVLNRAWSDQTGPDQFTVAVDSTRFRTRCGYLHLELGDDGLTMQSGAPDCEGSVVFGERQLSNPAGVGAMLLRVAARRVAGGIELGVQRLIQGRWETLRQPSDPLFRVLPQGQWRFSSEFGLPLPAAAVSGQLRGSATITTRGGEFALAVDGRTYQTRCGRLDLDILTEHILVDTLTEDCQRTAPLLTICPTSDCDDQQNAAYDWESRQIGATLDAIELTLPQARDVVNALFADYFPRSTPPTVSFSDEQVHGHGSEREIVLGTNTRVLGAAVHELAHALVQRAGKRMAGHNGVFTAMLLDLWERYFPIVDISAARADAQRSGLEIASQPPARAVGDLALDKLNDLLCDRRPVSEQLCQSFVGAMPQAAGGSVDGRYVGFGSRGDDFFWGVDQDEDPLRSYVVSDTTINGSNHEARLRVECQNSGLEIDLYWDLDHDLDRSVRYRVNADQWQDGEWRSGWGRWGDAEYKWTGLEQADDLIAQLAWAAQSGGTFTAEVRERDNESRRYTAAWPLDGLFETPVQPNLARCGG